MKFKQKFRVKNLFLILIFFSCYQFAAAQGFKGIVPLESTCEDIKRILQVEKCTIPQSTFWLKDYTISIDFTKEKPTSKNKFCYKVPAGRVIAITVSYNKLILIKDYEYDLKYSDGPFGDIDTVAYENSENGVSVLTNNGYINTAIFAPTPKQHKKFAYECQTSIK